MAAASPAMAQASDCAMGKDAPAQPADHGKMPCCTSDCTAMGTAGVLHPGGVAIAELQPVRAALTIAPVKQLDSLDWATADPPPRG
jgi:hypothetical protein